MAEILLFQHAQGQTDGFLAFADELRAAGHVVHAPDLYDGKTFADITEGVGYAKQVGFGTIIERGVTAAEDLPSELVYGGFSLGALPCGSRFGFTFGSFTGSFGGPGSGSRMIFGGACVGLPSSVR